MSRKITPLTVLGQLTESNKAFEMDASSNQGQTSPRARAMDARKDKSYRPKTPMAKHDQDAQDPWDTWEFHNGEDRSKLDLDFLDIENIQPAAAAAAAAPVSPPRPAQPVVLGVDSDSDEEEERNAKKAKKGLFKWCYFVEKHPLHCIWNAEKHRWEPVKIISKYKQYLTM